MLALQFRYNLLRYAWVRAMGGRSPHTVTGPGSYLRLTNVSEPPLPTPHWVRVRPLLSGICGSDLAVLSARSSIYLSGFTSSPFVPGHEVVGVVEETGSAVSKVKEGQRVVLEPALSCRVRGIEETCRPCSEGHDSSCEYVTLGDISPGIQTGYCMDTGGGWGANLVAHESQLYPIPDSLRDSSAVLVEPLSCSLHGVLLAQLPPDVRVLVLGCGTMGLLTIAALRYLVPSAHVVAVGKQTDPKSG